MSQEIILKYLENRRAMGDDKFYSGTEIYKLLRDDGIDVSKNTVWPKCCQLVRYRFIEGKNPDPFSAVDRHNWTLTFRGKKC